MFRERVTARPGPARLAGVVRHGSSGRLFPGQPIGHGRNLCRARDLHDTALFKDDDPILAIVRMREPPGTFLILSGGAVLDSCVGHDFAL
jgi:hypothetical protein